MLSRLNRVLAVGLFVVVVMAATVGVDFSRPNVEILPDMKYTTAWEAFAPNSLFADGPTMRPPVLGTVARGQRPLHYAATKEDGIRAGDEIRNPYFDPAAEPSAATTPATAAGEARWTASLERGAEVYRIFCITCHGPSGAGDGIVPQRGFPPPPSMLTGNALAMKDGQMFHVLTYGQGNMSSFAAQLTPDRRWDVINFVRKLQRAAGPGASAPLEGPVDPGTGEVDR